MNNKNIICRFHKQLVPYLELKIYKVLTSNSFGYYLVYLIYIYNDILLI